MSASVDAPFTELSRGGCLASCRMTVYLILRVVFPRMLLSQLREMLEWEKSHGFL